jgi:hypothetical protein
MFVYSAIMKLELCVLVLVLHDAGGFLISSPAAQLAIEVGWGGGGFSRGECGVYSVNPHLTGGQNHRVHTRVAIATFCRTFHHGGKISP